MLFSAIIPTKKKPNIKDFMTEGKIVDCPYCRSVRFIKHGKTLRGKQRYRCRDCLKSFSSREISVGGRPKILTEQSRAPSRESKRRVKRDRKGLFAVVGSKLGLTEPMGKKNFYFRLPRTYSLYLEGLSQEDRIVLVRESIMAAIEKRQGGTNEEREDDNLNNSD